MDNQIKSRRLSAIMFTDIVGYSKMVEKKDKKNTITVRIVSGALKINRIFVGIPIFSIIVHFVLWKSVARTEHRIN
mgnify:CR=1 FL=1